MTVNDGVILVLVSAVAWFWWHQDRFHRRALALAKQACDRASVQLLDDSVGLRRLRLARGGQFGVQIVRVFGFEFSQTGANRYAGTVAFSGQRLQSVDLDLSRPLLAG